MKYIVKLTLIIIEFLGTHIAIMFSMSWYPYSSQHRQYIKINFSKATNIKLVQDCYIIFLEILIILTEANK